MTTYNFDKITNRKGTNCLKYDFAVERGKPADVLPLWVADMDFPVSEEISKSLHAAVEHGIYGYPAEGCLLQCCDELDGEES